MITTSMRSSEDAAMETPLYLLLPSPDTLVNGYDATHPGKARCDAGSLNDRTEDHAVQQNTDVVANAHSLAGCLDNGFTLELTEEQQLIRADLKAATYQGSSGGVVYRVCKQRVWSIAKGLATKTKSTLAEMDGKARPKTMGSLLKR
ncbi:hypothetical protein PHMEG_00033252 [Phytophthora megakarya]|uniref:Uncharacterized protein n=1 Tax=Phytophthora megakarya TaxID=4795 RepID=A0A225UU09_9STRA|nr:hypothetical protein PHMEG_00033252 [Phytophthora megakarya]